MPRFEADNWNKLKNMASKAIGEKMKKKEPVGDSESLEDSLVAGLAELKLEQCQGLTVTQIKRIRWALLLPFSLNPRCFKESSFIHHLLSSGF